MSRSRSHPTSRGPAAASCRRAGPRGGRGGLGWGGGGAAADVRGAGGAARRRPPREGPVSPPGLGPAVPAILRRAGSHDEHAARCLPVTLNFVRALVRICPYVLSVSIAGSLASGGFLPSDDVDLDLVVEDGHRHLAYVALNLLGLAHALRHRGKPVDTHTRRPVAPRFMNANLILERSQCLPLARQDEDMAYELMVSRPVYGLATWRRIVSTNPGLPDHFPQLEERRVAPGA